VFIFHQREDSSLLVEVAQAHLLPQNHELVRKSHVSKRIFFFLTLNTLIPGKKEKGAPDLSNQEYFPTLSAAVAIEQNNYKLKKYRFIWL
jgi:hypothetical protein